VLLVLGLAEAQEMMHRLTDEVDPEHSRAVLDIGGEIARRFRRYFFTRTFTGAVTAVLTAIVCWWMGVNPPLVWGIFSFITNFIPNIGFVIGVIPPALLGLLEDGWGKALTVVLVYSGINVVIQTFIQPRYVGATVGLSAEMTFLSLVVWTFLLGPLGALLAVPMTLLVRALLIDPDARAAWVSPLISTTPDPPEDDVAPASDPDPNPEPAPAPAPAPS
jgi:predicted PurR-regulated permease PerM